MSVEAEEKWLPVLGFETSYEVSNLGRVRSLPKEVVGNNSTRLTKERILKLKTDKDGYHIAVLCARKKYHKKVHRLVCESFNGPNIMNLPLCRHKDGNKVNNTPLNLEWSTYLQNMADKVTHGTMPMGDSHPTRKLNEKEVVAIYHRLIKGEKRTALAAEFHVSWNTIDNIKNKSTWKSVLCHI